MTIEKEPKTAETIKQEIISNLCDLKNNYKDGIPSEIKHSTSVDSGWKVQRGVWFQDVANTLSDILKKSRRGEIIISKGLFDETFAYYNNLTSEENSLKQRLTKQEDIDEAESVINKILNELK
jgi:hypothetical protein